jgi:hypothetical protein
MRSMPDGAVAAPYCCTFLLGETTFQTMDLGISDHAGLPRARGGALGPWAGIKLGCGSSAGTA